MKTLSNLIIIDLVLSLFLLGCGEKNTDIPVQSQLNITGCWEETEESQANAEYRIRELRFDANGFFGVTWHPFETYIDYWGMYELNGADGTITLHVSNGAYVPVFLDLNGSISTNQAGELILLDMYLGDPQGSSDIGQSSKKYVFKKFAVSCIGTAPGLL